MSWLRAGTFSEAVERNLIGRAMTAVGGNRSGAAGAWA